MAELRVGKLAGTLSSLSTELRVGKLGGQIVYTGGTGGVELRVGKLGGAISVGSNVELRVGKLGGAIQVYTYREDLMAWYDPGDGSGPDLYPVSVLMWDGTGLVGTFDSSTGEDPDSDGFGGGGFGDNGFGE